MDLDGDVEAGNRKTRQTDGGGGDVRCGAKAAG